MKFNTRDNKKIFFGSDFHLYHDKDFLYGIRGFSNREEHTQFIINDLNNRVGEDDILFHLGDLCLTCTYDMMIESLLSIKCKNIYFILGNHDQRLIRMFKRFKQLDECSSIDKHDYFTQSEIELYKTKHYYDLGQYREICIQEPNPFKGEKDIKYPITLCHFPMSIWNFMTHGAWHLCGHSHGSFAETNTTNNYGKKLDVGVDNAIEYNNSCVFSFEELKEIMYNKFIQELDHHKE